MSKRVHPLWKSEGLELNSLTRKMREKFREAVLGASRPPVHVCLWSFAHCIETPLVPAGEHMLGDRWFGLLGHGKTFDFGIRGRVKPRRPWSYVHLIIFVAGEH